MSGAQSSDMFHVQQLSLDIRCALFWGPVLGPPFGDRLSARGGQRADAGAAMLSAPGVGRCAGILTHRGGCSAQALGLLSCCVGVAVAVFGRSAVLWARRAGRSECVCAGVGGRGAAGCIAEQVVGGKGVAP